MLLLKLPCKRTKRPLIDANRKSVDILFTRTFSDLFSVQTEQSGKNVFAISLCHNYTHTVVFRNPVNLNILHIIIFYIILSTIVIKKIVILL